VGGTGCDVVLGIADIDRVGDAIGMVVAIDTIERQPHRHDSHIDVTAISRWTSTMDRRI